MDEAIRLSLETWYPKDHPLHFDLHHPLGKLVGEWGELLDDYMKYLYKPGYEFEPLGELIDIWYYIRILSYQTDIKYKEMYLKGKATLLISGAIEVASSSFTLLCDNVDISSLLPYLISHNYSTMNRICKLTDLTVDQLTDASWEKLKPGSERGEEWMKVKE